MNVGTHKVRQIGCYKLLWRLYNFMIVNPQSPQKRKEHATYPHNLLVENDLLINKTTPRPVTFNTSQLSL